MSEPTGFDAVIEAMTIFRKYENPDSPFNCEHDTLTICIDPQHVTAEDVDRLDTLGFFISDDPDPCFISFRYGSA